MESPTNTNTRKSSTSSRTQLEKPASASMTGLPLNLPGALELASSPSPPIEEKIAYDPSIRQLQNKERTSSFRYEEETMTVDAATAGESLQPSSSNTNRLSSDQRSMERKPLPSHPLDEPDRSATGSPQYDEEIRKGSSFPEPVLDGSFPEVVTPDMQANMARKDSHARGQSVGTYKSSPTTKPGQQPQPPTQPNTPPPRQNQQPFSPAAENMTMDASEFDTVTPLHLLGDQPDMIDCPFCLRRTETKVIKKSSHLTHIWATGLGLTTLFIACYVPYKYDWFPHIEQHCTNCNRRVCRKGFGDDEVEVFGTPLHLRQVSRYPAAEYDQAPQPPSKTNTPPL